MRIRARGSFAWFLVDGPRVGPGDASFCERLRERRHRAIDSVATTEPRAGWVVAGTFSSSDFRPERVFLGRTAVWRLRIDRKRLPANAVRVRLAEALAGSAGRATREARARLRDEIERELLERQVPETKIADVLYDPGRGLLLLRSTARTVSERFRALWRETFDTLPAPATPTALASRAGKGSTDLAGLVPVLSGETSA